MKGKTSGELNGFLDSGAVFKGELEFEDGKLTQVKAGRVLRGSGWKRQNEISQQKD